MSTPHSNNTPQQPNVNSKTAYVKSMETEQVREAIRPYIRHLDNQEAALDAILALFTTAQIQLVSELQQKLPPRLGSGMRLGHDYVINEVEKLLEHKKQELERGK